MNRQKILVASLGIAALVLVIAICASGWRRVLRVLNFERSIEVRATVDGVDVIQVQGDRLWIEHHEYVLPSGIEVNGERWEPEWDGPMSGPLRGLHPPLPQVGTFRIEKLAGRGAVTIAEPPSDANGHTLTIIIDDRAPFGADRYEFFVKW
jgi:hypothetical protein